MVQEVVSNEPRASTSGDAGTQQPAMTLEQFKLQLKELEKGLRSLPATAQVTPPPPLALHPDPAHHCTTFHLHAQLYLENSPLGAVMTNRDVSCAVLTIVSCLDS